MEILSVSLGHARVLLHRLAHKGWVAPVVPGIYEFIPAERGEVVFVDTNPLALGSVLVEPYAFSFATTAYFYGLMAQASATVYLATPKGKTRELTVRGKKVPGDCHAGTPLFCRERSGCLWEQSENGGGGKGGSGLHRTSRSSRRYSRNCW
jgi:hypothetical protein